MKRLTLLLTMLLVFSTTLFAQKDVTKFLGIPVDGTKSEMIQKLKAKGFENHPNFDGLLSGEFNGEKVSIGIKTINRKVWRIAVLFDYTTKDEGQIKTRFNNLCHQFSNNTNYFSLEKLSKIIIPTYEDISYEITVNKKQYEADFLQLDNEYIDNQFDKFCSKYTQEQLDNPTEEIQAELNRFKDEMTENGFKKLVWFCISENYGSYRICLYYENLYNKVYNL